MKCLTKKNEFSYLRWDRAADDWFLLVADVLQVHHHVLRQLPRGTQAHERRPPEIGTTHLRHWRRKSKIIIKNMNLI